MSEYINKIVDDIPNDKYHSMSGTYSSSQLKVMLEDEEKFYKKYITKELEKEEGSQFDVGTYFHTAILEPHKLHEECAVFEGKRIGKAWDSFKEENKGKAIITTSDKVKADGIIQAVKMSPVAMDVLKGCRCEIAAFIKVWVYENVLFSVKEDCVYYLNLYHGWLLTNAIDKETLDEVGVSIILKVKADAINFSECYIADLKSTSGNCKNVKEMRYKISDYSYDLSASFYLDVFSLVTGHKFDKFAWIFASKDSLNSKTYWASESNVRVGRAKWAEAVINLTKNIKNNWIFKDTCGELDPNDFELAWLKRANEDRDLEL